MTEYKGNKDVLIGDCDCTADGKSLCEEVGVQGYPTIKYGDPSALEDYQGGRDFDSLKKHAEIEKLQAMSAADLEKEISGKEAEISEAEKTFKSEVEKLQAAYKKLQQTKEDTIKNVKDSGLGLMKAVKAANKKK